MLYDVRVIKYVLIYFCCLCGFVYCYPAIAVAAVLLLAAAVLHRVPGDTILLLWFDASDSSVLFLFIQTRFIFN